MNRNVLSTKKYQKSRKYFILATCLCLVISIVLFYKINNTFLLNELKNIEELLKNNHINFLLMHFITLAIFLFSSLTIIGLLLFPFYFLFEGICIFFNIIMFTRVFFFKGFIYSLMYISITKAIYLILLYFIFKKLLCMIRAIALIKMEKSKIDLKEIVHKNIKPLACYILLIFLNDLFLYCFGNKILLKLFRLIVK